MRKKWDIYILKKYEKKKENNIKRDGVGKK